MIRFNGILLLSFKKSQLQCSHHRNVSTDPLGTGQGSLGINEAQLENKCSTKFCK